jgi:ketosteroid isomerase-like protein
LWVLCKRHTSTAGENKENTMKIIATLLAASASAILTGGAGAGTGQSTPTTAHAIERPWPVSSVCSTFAEERNRQLLKERLQLLASGDFAADETYFADGAVVEVHGSVPFAGTYKVAGGEYGQLLGSIWQFGAATGEASDELTLYSDCDTVTLVGKFSATSRATGLLLDTTVIELFTFDNNGKIVRDDFYFTDTAEVNRVLGAG